MKATVLVVISPQSHYLGYQQAKNLKILKMLPVSVLVETLTFSECLIPSGERVEGAGRKMRRLIKCRRSWIPLMSPLHIVSKDCIIKPLECSNCEE